MFEVSSNIKAVRHNFDFPYFLLATCYLLLTTYYSLFPTPYLLLLIFNFKTIQHLAL
jgi:hypothetical protein